MPYIVYCGDDCELCPRYNATQNNEIEQLKEAAILWEKIGLHESIFPPNKMLCNGWFSLDYCHYNDIRECAKAKDVSNCGECIKYPCDKISEVFDMTVSYANKCKEMCSSQDYKKLHKAFFSKKERLDLIHLEKFTAAKNKK